MHEIFEWCKTSYLGPKYYYMNHFMLHFDLLIQQNESMKQHVHLEENKLWNGMEQILGFISLMLTSWTLSYAITDTINFFNTLSINTLMFFTNTSLHHFGCTSSLLQTRTTGILIWLAQTNNLDFTIISHTVSWLYT